MFGAAACNNELASAQCYLPATLLASCAAAFPIGNANTAISSKAQTAERLFLLFMVILAGVLAPWVRAPSVLKQDR
jgi:hypothetical protein